MKQIHFAGAESGSPNSAEWHVWRAGGIGGSDAPVIAYAAGLCGKSSWMRGVHDLWLRKTGQRTGPKTNSAMLRGQRNEAAAREAYEAITGNAVSPIFGEWEENPFVRASLDGISFDELIITEIKCPSRKVHELAKSDRIVSYYLPQLAHQGMTAWGHPNTWTDQHLFHFASFVPETGDIAIVELAATSIPVSDIAYSMTMVELASALLVAETEFWKQVTDVTAPCGSEWEESAALFLLADAELEEAKVAKEDIRQVLINLLGKEKKMEGGGVMAYRSEIKGKVDYKSAFEAIQKFAALPDDFMNDFTGKPSESIVVKVSEPKRKKSDKSETPPE